MKNTIFLFLLCSLSAFSQEITKDSTSIERVNGLYFSARYVEYDNGNAQTTRTIIGNGTAEDAFNVVLSDFKSKAKTMANDAVFVSQFPKQFTELIRQNAAIKTLLGKSPLDTIQAREIATYLAPGWTLKVDGVTTPIDVVFTVTQAGQMRHNLGTAPRNVTFADDIIRFHNYPAANDKTDFYKGKNGNFVTLDRKYILRKPGSTQQRSTTKPTTRTTRRQ